MYNPSPTMTCRPLDQVFIKWMWEYRNLINSVKCVLFCLAKFSFISFWFADLNARTLCEMFGGVLATMDKVVFFQQTQTLRLLNYTHTHQQIRFSSRKQTNKSQLTSDHSMISKIMSKWTQDHWFMNLIRKFNYDVPIMPSLLKTF